MSHSDRKCGLGSQNICRVRFFNDDDDVDDRQEISPQAMLLSYKSCRCLFRSTYLSKSVVRSQSVIQLKIGIPMA